MCCFFSLLRPQPVDGHGLYFPVVDGHSIEGTTAVRELMWRLLLDTPWGGILFPTELHGVNVKALHV